MPGNEKIYKIGLDVTFKPTKIFEIQLLNQCNDKPPQWQIANRNFQTFLEQKFAGVIS